MERADIDVELVRRLIAEQFPHWADRRVRPVAHPGWDNVTFRLGDDLSVRLPSADGYVPQVDKEHRWLPVLAPHLPLAIPRPVARGRPSTAFPRPWSVYGWLPGEPVTAERVPDLDRLAADLAGFLRALSRHRRHRRARRRAATAATAAPRSRTTTRRPAPRSCPSAVTSTPRARSPSGTPA